MANKTGKVTAKRKTTKAPVKKTVAATPPSKLPNVWQLARTTGISLWEHRQLLGGITLVYALLNVILAQGLSGSTDVSSLRQTLAKASKGHLGTLGSGFSGFGSLLGSSAGGSSTSSGTYQLFLLLIGSLAIIWALRQVLAGSQPRIRDSYYRGMSPLIPFVLVLLFISLQLIPLLAGSAIYAVIVNNGIATALVQKLLWGLLYAALAGWSFYMISSSLFAVYIVTLPDMTPLKALRLAKQLVGKRRWLALRKAIFLPVALLVLGAVIMLPIIIWLTPLSKWVFFGLTMLGLPIAHTYLYTLYRELLGE